MGQARDAPGLMSSDEGEKVEEILELQEQMEAMLDLETGSSEETHRTGKTVATNTTK